MSTPDLNVEYIQDVKHERQSWDLVFTLKDGAGDAVLVGQITTLTLFLYDRASKTPINMGDPAAKRDIKEANGATVDGDGEWTVPISADDMDLLVATAPQERRVALVEATWGTPTKETAIEFVFIIRNMSHRPAVEA